MLANWRSCKFPRIAAIRIFVGIRGQEMYCCSFVVRDTECCIAPYGLDRAQSLSVLMYQTENALAAQRSIISSTLFHRIDPPLLLKVAHYPVPILLPSPQSITKRWRRERAPVPGRRSLAHTFSANSSKKPAPRCGLNFRISIGIKRAQLGQAGRRFRSAVFSPRPRRCKRFHWAAGSV